MFVCEQSNYGILGSVISALSRSPGQTACSRSNSLVVDHPASSHAKVSPTNSLTVDGRHLSPPPAATTGDVALRSNSFLSVDYVNRNRHVIHFDTSVMTSPPNGLTSSEDESHLPLRTRSAQSVVYCCYHNKYLHLSLSVGTYFILVSPFSISFVPFRHSYSVLTRSHKSFLSPFLCRL